jgi:gamma-glutamylcyclotransferase (GGCT)/AIG2-like uncharacterized protein YtfP
MDLFVYGTLMVAEVMRRVSGFDQAGDVAVLHGHRRRVLSGELYPAIVPWPDCRVEGLLYRGLEPGQLAALDAFEGAMYRRVPVDVVIRADRFSAETYLLRKSWGHLLSDEDWSLQHFVSEGLREFLAGYPGFVPATAPDVADEQRH